MKESLHRLRQTVSQLNIKEHFLKRNKMFLMCYDCKTVFFISLQAIVEYLWSVLMTASYPWLLLLLKRSCKLNELRLLFKWIHELESRRVQRFTSNQFKDKSFFQSYRTCPSVDIMRLMLHTTAQLKSTSFAWVIFPYHSLRHCKKSVRVIMDP